MDSSTATASPMVTGPRLQALMARVLGIGGGDKRSQTRDVLARVRQLQTMLEAVPVGVVVASYPDGRLVMANRQLEALVRHPFYAAAGVQDYDRWVAFHDDGRQVQNEEWPIAKVLRGEQDRAELDVHYQCGDGVRRWMRVIGNIVRDDHGRTIGASAVLLDIEQERAYEAQQQLIIRELNHRFKNMLSVVRSTVNQSLRLAGVDEAILDTLGARLDAFAQAHDQIAGFDGRDATLDQICSATLAPHIADGRLVTAGPPVSLPERSAVAIAMALYELSTNAVKYGALSNTDGMVRISWAVEPAADGAATLSLVWHESGGPPPPADAETRQRGFGTVVTHRAAAMQTGGEVASSFSGDGYEWRLRCPVGEAATGGAAAS